MEERFQTRVDECLQQGWEAGVRQLFLIEASPDQRQAARAESLGRELIASDGPWRFYVETSPSESSEDRLWADMVSESGNLLGCATTKLHKGRLQQFEGVDGLVLTSEYDGCQPVALLRRLSKQTLHRVSGVLHDSREIELGLGFEPDSQDARAMAKLVATATPHGSVLSD